jgi:rhamnogalacturonyl hydrolase YesR
MFKKLLFITCIALMSGNITAQEVFSAQLSRKEIKEVANAVAEWQIANLSKSRHHILSWTNGALYIGMLEWANTTGYAPGYEFLDSIGKSNNWRMHRLVYHADDICVGQAFIGMYRKFNDPKMLQPAMERAFYVASHPSKAVFQKSNPKGKDERWTWCDALFMAPPVYAALYSLTGEDVYYKYMDSEYKMCVDSLYDKEEKLFYRDNMRIPLREPNGAKQFWGRGNGWVFGGLPLIIDNLPRFATTTGYYVNLFRELAASVKKTQDKNGAWHASLLNPASYPEPENSASAFFCYGLAWGIRNKHLSRQEYEPVLIKAWQSLVSYVDKDGKLGYVQPVGADPQKVSRESTDVYGVGAFLLAGSELYKLYQK